MSATSISSGSAGFDRAIAELAKATWRPDLRVEEIGSPQRIAPYSLAVSGELSDRDDELASGRLILLHDPAGNDTWQGVWRCVTFARASVDLDMVLDPLLPEVGWSWLTEALGAHDAAHLLPAGTVTAVYSQSFGEMAGQTDSAEVEIRASWTPLLAAGQPLQPHLSAWQDLLCLVAGAPALPPDVVALRPRAKR